VASAATDATCQLVVPCRSGGSRKSPEHPFTKDADAIQVRRSPAHKLQSEIADGVLAQFLGEDYVLDTLPALEKPTVLILPSNSPTVL
jgi:hypothetical protein